MNWQSVGDFFSHIINYLILALALYNLWIWFKVFVNKKEIKKELANWEKDQNLVDFDKNTDIKDHYKRILKNYVLFTTFITIFPLLGMLGTVSSLLGLDMSNTEAISNAKDSFFYALTSTFLGIIFAIFFKWLNARSLYDIEDILERILKVIKDLRQESIDETKKQKTWWKYEN